MQLINGIQVDVGWVVQCRQAVDVAQVCSLVELLARRLKDGSDARTAI